jgi:AcrR family transcriptional regulator
VPSRPSRAEWGSLSRASVIAAATTLMTEQGADALSIRAVAARLGVSPMALYRHVASKDDLLGEVVDHLFAEHWRPDIREDPWREWIADVADRLRQFLVEHPAALHVYLAHPVVTPAASQRMDACLAVLKRGLSDDGRAHHAYGAIQTYTIGFAALESARHNTASAGSAVATPAKHENSARARTLAAYASPQQFLIGLHYLLYGIDASD